MVTPLKGLVNLIVCVKNAGFEKKVTTAENITYMHGSRLDTGQQNKSISQCEGFPKFCIII